MSLYFGSISQHRSTSVLGSAESLAADLAGASVDPNEAQKALAYLRAHRDERQFFGYLRAVVNDGRAVIRSGQTLGYYRDLLAACERHLRGLPPEQMAQTLGWAIRLLRYYRAVPNAERPERTEARTAASVAASPMPETLPAQRSQPAEPRVEPPKPQIPSVGDVFAGKVLGVDESVVMVEIAGFTQEQAVGVLRAEAIGGSTSRYREGNSARVEVTNVRTLKSGRTVVELKPGKRQGQI